jgi:hypothetical protein
MIPRRRDTVVRVARVTASFYLDTVCASLLMLFDESLDGFEDPSTDINKHFRVGDLRPEAWFKFFNNVEPRDPNRGFRR